MHNAHLHTDDRAFRSGKTTKQNAHKCVLALDIQSLMNTTLVLMRKEKTYEDGLELRTSKMLDKISTTKPLSTQAIFAHLRIHCCKVSRHELYY